MICTCEDGQGADEEGIHVGREGNKEKEETRVELGGCSERCIDI